MPSIASLPEYTTVLAQVFSPDGDLYAAATLAGDLAVWRVSSLEARGEKRPPLVTWRPHRGFGPLGKPDVLSLATAGAFLLTGGRGVVLGWDWDNIANTGQVEEPDWALEVPGGAEVNSMLVLAEGGTQGRLVLGAGDNKVYIFDLETRRLVSSLSGHSDYVHSVAAGQEGGDGGTLVSGSEDGTVRLWDARKAEEVHCLTPAEKDQLARPHLGKHVSCVAVASDWVVCGGGPRLGLWHLRTLSPSVTLPPGDVEAKAVSIHDDTLLCGGKKVVYQTNLTGEVTAEVAVSSTVTYSLAWQNTGGHKLLCVAGSSSYIDICTNNFNYRDATISFPVSLP